MIVLLGLVVFAFCLTTSPVWASDSSANVVKIGFVEGDDFRLESSTLQPTLDYLKEKLPQYQFELTRISPVDTLDELKEEHINLLVAPSSYYLVIAEDVNVTHIATRTSVYADNASRSVGSVFITKSDRSDIQTIKDMKGKTSAASLPNSIGGWLAARGELEKQGFDSESFFKNVIFYQFQVPDVMDAVLSGAADVGILTTCVLEKSIAEGILERNAFRVINSQDGGNEGALRCQYSTSELYPDLEVVVLHGTPDSVVRDITVALLEMPAFDGYQWSIESNRLPLRNLFRTLKIGPYEYLKDNSLSGLYHRYRDQILLVLFLIACLILNEFRLHRLVRKRTAELEFAVQEKERINEIAKKERYRLSILERNGVISYMSSIIAHEAKQPIATILNYVEVLRMHLSSKSDHDSFANGVVSAIEEETDRIDSLVNSVRHYAKHRESPLVKSNLVKIAAQALKTFETNEASSEIGKIDFLFACKDEEIPVLADALSLELLILNLVRNGAQAALSFKAAFYRPKLGIQIHPVENNRVQLDVWNTGSTLSDEDFDRLTAMGGSTKSEGLGIGLGIVREIADHHGADLTFKRRDGGGVIAVLVMDVIYDK